jgi:hypothetical protein
MQHEEGRREGTPAHLLGYAVFDPSLSYWRAAAAAADGRSPDLRVRNAWHLFAHRCAHRVFDTAIVPLQITAFSLRI